MMKNVFGHSVSGFFFTQNKNKQTKTRQYNNKNSNLGNSQRTFNFNNDTESHDCESQTQFQFLSTFPGENQKSSHTSAAVIIKSVIRNLD